ncbi:MAG: thioredoxin family protein [Candidatus Aminicenantes bacterium]|nr:thioredoxin family protein [Candidatus Aminicenantes bacterium]
MKRFLLSLVALAFVGGSVWAQKEIDRATILQDPEWAQVYEAYVPDAVLIENLRGKAPELKIDVYLGTWCSDSKNHVPVFLKILDAVNVPELKVRFFAVDRKADPGQKYFVNEAEVEKVPTFIFFVNGFEMGRIVENPKNSLLQDMMIIVF